MTFMEILSPALRRAVICACGGYLIGFTLGLVLRLVMWR